MFLFFLITRRQSAAALILIFIFAVSCSKSKNAGTATGTATPNANTPPLPNTIDRTDTLQVMAYSVLNYGDGCQGPTI